VYAVFAGAKTVTDARQFLMMLIHLKEKLGAKTVTNFEHIQDRQ